jgi:NhaP-type Na+/H+ or K+/H+ antiporter
LDKQHLILIGLTAVVVVGIAAQWLAWRARVPAILMLLLFGILAGPVPEAWGPGRHKLLDPDFLFGRGLYPVISLSVAVILFEGGLTLNLSELRQVGRVLRNLVTIGAAVTWVVTTAAARLILGLPWPLALLLGAILVVTGPTVIGPLLRHVKPVGQVGPILKWEGIVIDPIGATMALLVFEAVPDARLHHLATTVGGALLKTVLFGGAVGLLAAAILVLVFRRFWVADYLQNPVTLAFVLAAFTGANLLQDEAGLLAVTAMGVALANQRFVPFKHILEFKEGLSVLLVSSLFVLLGSRLSFSQFSGIGVSTFLFLLVMFVVARPAGVLLSTVRSSLSWRERAFLCWMAPRGIVAAAVSSIFAVRLRQAGIEGSERLVPVTFSVIISTVLVYGLTASWLAKRLGLAGGTTSGFLIAGANPLARVIAEALRAEGQQVLLVDTSPANVVAARLAGLDAQRFSVVSDEVVEQVEGTGIARLLALTPNEEVNTLAAVHFGRIFGRSQVYQLAPEAQKPAAAGPAGPSADGRASASLPPAGGSEAKSKEKQKVSQELHGRVLFAPGITFEALAAKLAAGAKVRRTLFTTEFDYDDFRGVHPDGFVPLFLITPTGEWTVCTADDPVTPAPGQVLISLVAPEPTAAEGSSAQASPRSEPVSLSAAHAPPT